MMTGVHSRLISILAAALTLLGIPTAVQADPAAIPQVFHQLRVSLDPANQRLTGHDSLRLPAFDGAALVLRLSPSARVTTVRVGEDPVSIRFHAGVLEIPIPRTAQGRTLTVTVAYEVTFRGEVPESPLNTEDPTYGVSGVIIPEGVFLLAEAGWYPDLTGYDARFDVEIQTPESFRAVTAGRMASERVESGRRFVNWLTEHPVKGLALSAAPYVVQSLETAAVPIATYFLPASDDLSRTYLEAARDYLDLYSERFGPYPFPKFAIVENFFPTGYGFPSYTLLGSSVIRLPFISRTSLGHEVAHSWWGNCVFADASRGNWAEGLVTYVADHFYREQESPEAARQYRMQILRNFATLVPEAEDFPLRDFLGRTSPASRTIGYGKGAMLFHMVRCLIGEDAFWGGLRDVYRGRRFEHASWDDFSRAFGRRADRDLGPVFSQWVDRPGVPTLALEQVSARREGDRYLVSGTLRQAPPTYDLMVPIRVEDEAGSVTRAEIALRESITPFTLSAERPPARIVVDPEVNLLRRLAPSEIPSDINMLRASFSLIVVVARGAPAEWREAAALLLAGLGREKAAIVDEERFRPEEHPGRDLLFLGIPENRERLPAFPTGLTVHRDAFEWNGRRFAKPGDVLFAVVPASPGAERLTAILLPMSPAPAKVVARKIHHYGTSSLLIFEDGTNVVKETWPVVHSPLVQRLLVSPGP